MLVLSLRKAVKAAAVCPPVTGAATAQGLSLSGDFAMLESLES